MGTFALGALVIMASLAAAYLWLPAIGDPSPQALEHSLTRTADGSVSGVTPGCEKRSSRRWTCEIPDFQGSGSGTYRVRMQDTRCWRARKISPNRDEEGTRYLPKRTSGCVMWRDQLRLGARFF